MRDDERALRNYQVLCPTCKSVEPQFYGTSDNYPEGMWRPYPHGTGFIDVCLDEWHEHNPTKRRLLDEQEI